MKVHIILFSIITPLMLIGVGAETTHSPTDIVRLKKVKEFVGFDSGEFGPDGSVIALGSSLAGVLRGTSEIKIINAATLNPVCEIRGFGKSFPGPIAFANRDNLVVEATSVVSATKPLLSVIALYDTSTCKPRKELASEETESDNRELTVSSDGKLLAANLNSVRIWNLQTGLETYRQELPNGFVPIRSVLSPDGGTLVTLASKFIPPKRYWSMSIQELATRDRRELSDGDNMGFRFSDDGRWLYVADTYVTDESKQTRLTIFSTSDWKRFRTLEGLYPSISFDVSSRRQLLVTGAEDGRFRIYSLANGKMLGTFVYYERTKLDDIRKVPHMIDDVIPVRFSPDGTMLLTGGARGNVILWKLELDESGS